MQWRLQLVANLCSPLLNLLLPLSPLLHVVLVVLLTSSSSSSYDMTFTTSLKLGSLVKVDKESKLCIAEWPRRHLPWRRLHILFSYVCYYRSILQSFHTVMCRGRYHLCAYVLSYDLYYHTSHRSQVVYLEDHVVAECVRETQRRMRLVARREPS